MVQVGFNNNNDTDYADPIRYDLGHEARYQGTIAEVSDIYSKENQFSDDDEEIEELRIAFRTSLDDLDVDDDTREQLREYINNKIEEQEEEGYDVDHPEDAVEVVMFPTAKVTPGTNDINASKLFETLQKLGLAEADSDGNVTLYDRDGEEANPFEELDDDATEQDENEAFASYLRQNMTGMEVTYELRNAKRNTDDEYSVVSKVISLDNDPQVEE